MTTFIAVTTAFIFGLAVGISLPRRSRRPPEVRCFTKNTVRADSMFWLASGVADTWVCKSCGVVILGENKATHKTWHQVLPMRGSLGSSPPNHDLDGHYLETYGVASTGTGPGLSGLTAEEARAFDALTDAIRAIRALPVCHPADPAEDTRDFHNLQNRLLQRAAVRLNLGTLTHTEGFE